MQDEKTKLVTEISNAKEAVVKIARRRAFPTDMTQREFMEWETVINTELKNAVSHLQDLEKKQEQLDG